MTRFNVSFIALSLALFLFSSCANHKTVAALNNIETYIMERPDSALAAIRAIDTMSLKTPRLRAHYALLYAMALDKNWIDTTDVNVVMPAVEYYDRHSSGIRRAKAWYYLGRIQQNGSNRPDASISFLKAEKYAEGSDDLAFIGLVYQSLSSIYSQTFFHEEALSYSERAYSLFVSARDTLNANASLFCRANDLFNLERYDEADTLYCSLIENDLVHPNLRQSLLRNYALSLVIYHKEYDKAVQLFDGVIATTGTLNNRNTWGAYAYSLVRIGRKEQAEKVFKQLESGKGDAYLSYSYWKSQAAAYIGDYASAYRFQEAAYDIQDDNVKKAFRKSAIKAQKDFLEEMNREAEEDARRRQLIVWCLYAILIVTIVSLMLIFNLRNKRNEQEKESILQAYQELTSQADEEKARIRDQYIQMCQSHFGHIGRINEMLNVYINESGNNLYKELKKSIQTIGLDMQNQDKFEKMLDESFDSLMTHFREAFPKKKQRYYQLVSYIFAGFSTTTICIMIPSYNKHNVHVEKSRLRQMIQDTDSPYKEQFLRFVL